MSSDGVNTRNCLLPRNDFANRNHSLNGEQDFSRECDSLLNQNFLIGQLISPNSRFVYGSTSSNFTAGIVPRYLIHDMQSHVLTPPNSRFVYGLTSSDFAPGINSGYSMYGTQRHVLSDSNSPLIADQRFHHTNLSLESQSSQFGDREEAEAFFSANGIVLGMLAFIVPSL